MTTPTPIPPRIRVFEKNAAYLALVMVVFLALFSVIACMT